MKIKKPLRLGLIVLFAHAPLATACDLCRIYESARNDVPQSETLRLGLVEQFTAFDRVQRESHKIDNEEHQHLESSITQVVGVYDINELLSVQASLPYINRRYKRVEEETTSRGTEAGIGDLTILLRAFPIRWSRENTIVNLSIFGGLKVPTGDSDRLKEELEEGHHDIEIRHGGEHHGGTEDSAPSAIHGHDLALGSGSVDVPLGASLMAHWGRFLIGTSGQYTIRTEGGHSYEYADDILWSAGPGVALLFAHEDQVVLRAVLSGEYKRNDKGQSDTALSSLFLGPELSANFGDRFSTDIAVDLPLDVDNSGVQAIPTSRIRAAVTWRF